MQAGFGISDITPRIGVQLAGYGPFLNRHARKIHAPLHARAAVFDCAGNRAVVVSVELCGLTVELADRIRKTIAPIARCRPDQVFLSSTHTHSGPATAGHIGWGEPDGPYIEMLPIRVAASVREAVDKLGPADIRTAMVPCEGIAINREQDDAYCAASEMQNRLSDSWRPRRPELTDPRCRVLSVYQQNHCVGVLHHFGCHAVVCGEQTSLVHGDFVGEASLIIERRHARAVALFLPGAIGDINPPASHLPPAESLRALRTLGRRYARYIEAGIAEGQSIDESQSDIRIARRMVSFSRVAWSRAGIVRRIRALEHSLSDSDGSDTLFEKLRGGESRGIVIARLNGLRQILAGFRGEKAPNSRVPVHALAIGPITLIGAGVEIHHSIGEQIRNGLEDETTWVTSIVGGGSNYATNEHTRRTKGYAHAFVPLICGELPFKAIDRELPEIALKLARRLRPVRR